MSHVEAARARRVPEMLVTIAAVCVFAMIAATTAMAGDEDKPNPGANPEHSPGANPGAESGSNPVVFWELASHDAEATRIFLETVFGWQANVDKDTGFVNMPASECSAGPIGGGIFTLRKAKLPFLTVFALVDDVDAKAKMIEDAGGHLVIPPEDFGDNRICLFNEPSGVTLAIVERREDRDGPSSSPMQDGDWVETHEPNDPVVFWELASNDAEASAAFFTKVFGWSMQVDDDTGFRYIPAKECAEGPMSGGVFTLRKAKLPFLTVYMAVDDIEAKAKLIEESGGFIVEAPHETAGGLRICLFNEPSGVTFAMLQRKKAE